MKSVFLYIGVERVRMAYMGLQWGMGELLGWVVWRAWRGQVLCVNKGYNKDEDMEKADKKTTVYFNNVPQIGDLFLEQVLFSYDYEPIVFTCKDNKLNRYLCICDDIIESRSWIVTKISNSVLTEVINSERSILSVFEDSESKTLIIDYDHGNYYYRFSDFKDIDEDELPSKDQYLN